MEKQGRIKNKLYLQTRLFNQYAVPQAVESQESNARLKLQSVRLLLQILWMFSVSGSRSLRTLVHSGYMAITSLH